MKEKAENIYHLFEGGATLNIVFFVLAILSVILAIYYYFLSKKTKNLTYIVHSFNVIRKGIYRIENVEIFYAGNKVEDLSITKVAIWNDGKDTINYSDVAKNAPIKIVICDSNEILQAEILYEKNRSNDFKIILSEDHKSVTISFDYFDHREGVIVKLIHTASSNKDIGVVGTIKTVKKINRRNESNIFAKSRLFGAILGNKPTEFLFFSLGCASVLVGILAQVFSPNYIVNLYVKVPLLVNFSFVVIGIVYILLGRNAAKRSMPEGFEDEL